jgi:GT2 family glycosyltransferase
MNRLVELTADKDVIDESDYFIATSDAPWLRISDPDFFNTSGYFDIEYSSHFFDDPVRPILRFITDTEIIDRALPGPVAGIALSRVFFPKNIKACLISPVNKPGIFNFRIKRSEQINNFQIFFQIIRQRPIKIFSIFLALIFGYKKEAMNAIDWVINNEPMKDFPDWLERRLLQKADVFQAPRLGSKSNLILQIKYLIILDARNSEQADVQKTLMSILKQHYINYTIIIDRSNGLSKFLPNVEGIKNQQSLTEIELKELLSLHNFIFFMAAESVLHEFGLNLISEYIERNQFAKIIYFDEMIVESNVCSAYLKPDWSPIFYSSKDYIGGNYLISSNEFIEKKCLGKLNEPQEVLKSLSLGLSLSEVIHIRRFLITKPSYLTVGPHAPSSSSKIRSSNKRGAISIIVPTRDRLDLLKPCIESMLLAKLEEDDEIIIIDNKSSKKNCLDYLSSLEKNQAQLRVLSYDKPFNYSAMNNYAAHESKGEVLIFLNNDTEIITPNWLEILENLATKQQIGAVGACLLFPNGLIQHSGIVIGMGQDAGHFQSFQKINDPSWLSRNSTPHEVSAVTGACLALEKSKFLAAGGFDADHFPVEFSDLDLCLRLMAAGFYNLYTPEVRVMHKESATRGRATARPFSVYADERANFQERWGRYIRDDPYFHPALSLYARNIALN